MNRISRGEFEQRIERIRGRMTERGLDLLLVYGDEYRKENLRYVSDYWPIFERGACLIAPSGEPVVLGAPEGEKLAQEMTVWRDTRLLKEFMAVTIPGGVDYPLAHYASLPELLEEFGPRGRRANVGIVGVDAMSHTCYEDVVAGFKGAELVDAASIVYPLRLIKSENEIEMLCKATEQAMKGYRELMKTCVPGKTELEATGAAEQAARAAGAEAFVFMVFGSGPRTKVIIGRPTEKVMEEGEMVIASFCVQYAGYAATVEIPFVVGGRPGADQKRILRALFEAEEQSLHFLRAGCKMKDFVNSVKARFAKDDFTKYDVYPPLHGCGLAEAELPYPHDKTEEVFQANMTVNTDISLFGHPAGANRIEEGFIITEDGPSTMSAELRELIRIEAEKVRS